MIRVFLGVESTPSNPALCSPVYFSSGGMFNSHCSSPLGKLAYRNSCKIKHQDRAAGAIPRSSHYVFRQARRRFGNHRRHQPQAYRPLEIAAVRPQLPAQTRHPRNSLADLGSDASTESVESGLGSLRAMTWTIRDTPENGFQGRTGFGFDRFRSVASQRASDDNDKVGFPRDIHYDQARLGAHLPRSARDPIHQA